ncbi:hypothetical protein ACH4S8_37150 [Streptomyces sp. NPDC021080]|uniref:hypothetical protein n=1 Tax=Streptomyces sp. NPDC021080 TaxID=3365110 RepID=UPI00379CD06C
MTAIKKPNASAVSRALAAKANGITVHSENSRTIRFAERPVGTGFPAVRVVDITDSEGDVAELHAAKLNSLGYHAEIHTLTVQTWGNRTPETYRAVIVFSQEELDDRVARTERAANATEAAENLVPKAPRILVREREYPTHARRSAVLTREDAVKGAADALAAPTTDVLTERGVQIALEYFERGDAHRTTGLTVYPAAGGRTVYFFTPTEEPLTMPEEPTTTEDTPPTVEEIVAAVRASERRDTVLDRLRETSDPREVGRAVVFHAYGMHDHERDAVDWTAVRTALLAPERLAVGTRVRHVSQQWATSVVAPKGTAVVVAVGREHHDGTCEYEVMAGQDFSRRVGPDNPMTRPAEWNSNAVKAVTTPPVAMTREEAIVAGTLPTLDGHTVRATLTGTMWTVALYEDGNPEPLYTDTIGDHVTNGPGQAANVLIFAREQQLKEAAALAALDDATLYQVCEYLTSAPTGDPVTMTGSEARARLQAARTEAGPEPIRSYGAPRFTLEHSGVHWWATTHAYKNGRRDQWNRRHISVRPLVVARAAHVIMEGTGDGCLSPVEKPSTRAYGPWVRAVAGHADRVVVARVATGFHGRPSDPEAGARWDEYMSAYRAALEGAGWTHVERTEDGDVYSAPR